MVETFTLVAFLAISKCKKSCPKQIPKFDEIYAALMDFVLVFCSFFNKNRDFHHKKFKNNENTKIVSKVLYGHY